MNPMDMIHVEFLKSNLGLETSPQEKVDELREAMRASGEGDELNRLENQRMMEKRDGMDRTGTPGLLNMELEGRQDAEQTAAGGGQPGGDERAKMLIDRSESDGVVGEENDVMDATEMCYDSVLFHNLHPEGSHEAQDAPGEYTETYMSTLGEREGVLISTVRAPSSPSTFFQASNMDVGGSTAMTASWEELNSTHAQSGYGSAPSSSDDASPGGGNSTEERAFVDSLCEEPLKEDCLDVGKDASLPDPSFENRGNKNARFEGLESSGGSDPENEYLSVLTIEDTACGGENRTPGTFQRKEKAAVGELSLRSALSDPLTGAFMDDAMVAMCGHSFGSGSLRRVLETHSCGNCGANVPPKTLVPNFALRAAVLAYKHEDQLWQLSSMKGTKRRRELFELHDDSEMKGTARDQAGSAENTCADSSRPKGVQFPFAVSDRVFIKGNKRTPERFFGMEAVITSQCLNGWYLVRTLDTGESVRLQYRSLQKLGETELLVTAEPRPLIEQCTDSHGSPLSTDSLKRYPNGTKPASEYGLESQSLASPQHDGSIAIYPCVVAESVKVHSSDREAMMPLEHSDVAADAGSCPALNAGTASNLSQEVGTITDDSDVVDGLSKTIDRLDEQVIDTRESLKGAAQGQTFSGISLKKDVDILTTTSTVRVESDDGQLLGSGLNRDAGSNMWIGTSICDAPVLKCLLGAPNIASPEPVGDALDAGKLPTVIRDQVNGCESFRTRSRRSSVHVKSLPMTGGFLQDSDPYRKVYTSGPRRRSTKGDSVITVIPDHLPADNKSLFKGTTGTGKSSEKTQMKGSSVGSSTAGKQGRELKLKSANEILQIMRKDMLKLEKQIPRNYLLRSWRVNRVNWQKQVQASHTVSELGAQVRDFRYSLLLTTAGGMPDEEWDVRTALIIESGDVELLVSLWGRLYSDVYKWLESRPKSLQGRDIESVTADMNSLQSQDPDVSKGTMSSVDRTTAATLAAVDSVAEGQQDPDTSIKALLASTVTLLQQQSRTELSAVKEALEWEKRHITSKLAHLERRFANLKGASELNRLEDDSTSLVGLLRRSQASQCASASVVPLSQFIASGSPLQSKQGQGTQECDSDTARAAQDADGEATDMSDSD